MPLYEFNLNDRVEVSDDGITWYERTYVGYTKTFDGDYETYNYTTMYVTRSEGYPDLLHQWEFIRPISQD
jgi:hypothetical protein